MNNNRKFFGIMYTVCVLPAFLSGIIIVFSSEKMDSLVTILAMVIGGMCLAFYAVAGAMLWSTYKFWNNQDEYEDAITKLHEQKEKFSRAESKLIIHLVREKAKDYGTAD